MKRDWMKKEPTRVRRRRGPRNLQKREKKRAPREKANMEVRDLTQA